MLMIWKSGTWFRARERMILNKSEATSVPYLRVSLNLNFGAQNSRHLRNVRHPQSAKVIWSF